MLGRHRLVCGDCTDFTGLEAVLESSGMTYGERQKSAACARAAMVETPDKIQESFLEKASAMLSGRNVARR
jgi:hypothetical protein